MTIDLDQLPEVLTLPMVVELVAREIGQACAASQAVNLHSLYDEEDEPPRYGDAKRALWDALRLGHLTASAIPTMSPLPVEIPPMQWRNLCFATEENRIKGPDVLTSGGVVVYREVRFGRSEVLRWLRPAALVEAASSPTMAFPEQKPEVTPAVRAEAGGQPNVDGEAVLVSAAIAKGKGVSHGPETKSKDRPQTPTPKQTSVIDAIQEQPSLAGMNAHQLAVHLRKNNKVAFDRLDWRTVKGALAKYRSDAKTKK